MRKAVLFSCLAALALVFAGNAQAEEAKKKKTEKKEAVAPDFTLPDINGNKHTLSKLQGKWVVLEWINHGCPFVKKHYNSGNMQALQEKYGKKGVIWLAVCSSAPGKQGHYTAEQWKELNKAKKGKAAAILLDPEGKVGRLYKAKTTPQMIVINPKGVVVYDGAIDDKPRAMEPAQVKAAKNYVVQVLDAVMAGKEPPVKKTKPYGCSVKYGAKPTVQ